MLIVIDGFDIWQVHIQEVEASSSDSFIGSLWISFLR